MFISLLGLEVNLRQSDSSLFPPDSSLHAKLS